MDSNTHAHARAHACTCMHTQGRKIVMELSAPEFLIMVVLRSILGPDIRYTEWRTFAWTLWQFTHGRYFMHWSSLIIL